MKKYFTASEFRARDHYILTRPVSIKEMTMDDLLDHDNYDWRSKAMRLQARRWRKIKHQRA